MSAEVTIRRTADWNPWFRWRWNVVFWADVPEYFGGGRVAGGEVGGFTMTRHGAERLARREARYAS